MSLDQISNASECLKFHSFMEGITEAPVTKLVSVAEGIMQKCYLSATETGYRSNWRQIVGWVDTAVFRGVATENEEAFEQAKNLAESILSFLRGWYENIFLLEHCSGYANLTLEQVVQGVTIWGRIPLIKLTETPTLVYIDDIATTESQMYNDIKIRGLLWLISEALDCEIVTAQHFAIGPRGGITVGAIEANQQDHERAVQMIASVALLIKNGYKYPSVTEKCNTCPFKRRCRL